MKKGTILILTYTLIAALVVAVKIVETYAPSQGQVIPGTLLACDPTDPPPPPDGGE